MSAGICPVCEKFPETVTHFLVQSIVSINAQNKLGYGRHRARFQKILLTSCHTSILLALLTKTRILYIKYRVAKPHCTRSSNFKRVMPRTAKTEKMSNLKYAIWEKKILNKNF